MNCPNKSQSAHPLVDGLYKMPWSDTQNAMAWLEVTRDCNLACDYCCQKHNKDSNKSLKTIEAELDALLQLRSCDSVIVAGGEPLLHPELHEVVRMVASRGKRPVILTNGVLLTSHRLRRLVRYGLFGVTFHVDARQNQPGHQGASETELNALRQHYADMVNAEGIHCGFNMVVFPETLHEVPVVARWANENADRVHVMMFIAGRTTSDSDPWDYYVNGEQVEIGTSAYATEEHEQSVMSTDLYDGLCTAFPGYRLNAFLGGTQNEKALKWAMGNHICEKGRMVGFLGPQSARFLQKFSHRRKGHYFSHVKPLFNRHGALAFFLGLWDKEVRKATRNRLVSLLIRPQSWLKRLYLQTFIVMQPMDFLEAGGQDHCDGCPNMTVYDGKLIRGCEVEAYLEFGGPFQTVPKGLPKNLGDLPGMPFPTVQRPGHRCNSHTEGMV